ncbi:interferon-like [Colius striatus]|uniref:interferon-like n=1 Tax=Colius striatus TaxID=57412 RepID=UPI002B1D56D6|nr:interferon-like [Colius striatus]
MPAPRTARTRRLRHGVPALLLLLPPLATTLVCPTLPPRLLTFPGDGLRLLQATAPSPTQPCQHDWDDAPDFPGAVLNTTHPQQAAHIALHILQHLFATFSSSSIPPHWDQQALHTLRNQLDHSIHHLRRCLNDTRKLSQGRGPRNHLLALHRYFSRLQLFPGTHHHSACAWDHVHNQALLCFQHVDTLLRRSRSRDASELHQTHPAPTPGPSRRQPPRLSTAHSAPRHEPAGTRP